MMRKGKFRGCLQDFKDMVLSLQGMRIQKNFVLQKKRIVTYFFDQSALRFAFIIRMKEQKRSIFVLTLTLVFNYLSIHKNLFMLQI